MKLREHNGWGMRTCFEASLKDFCMIWAQTHPCRPQGLPTDAPQARIASMTNRVTRPHRDLIRRGGKYREGKCDQQWFWLRVILIQRQMRTYKYCVFFFPWNKCSGHLPGRWVFILFLRRGTFQLKVIDTGYCLYLYVTRIFHYRWQSFKKWWWSLIYLEMIHKKNY